jgi:peptide-methionine (S)-S-oxide reductase
MIHPEPAQSHRLRRSPLTGLRLLLGIALLIAALLLPAPMAAVAAPEPVAGTIEEAVFAGGCFWCLEHDLEHLPGVLDAVSGYSGGSLANPSYRQVSAGGTGHQEAVRVRFDPARLSYATLLRAYWRNVDPLDGGGQFCDRGSSYQPVIFSAAGQLDQARASLRAAARELRQSEVALQVMIRPLQSFWPAEDYHQNYAEHNALKYRYYRWACGRDQRLDAVWGERARSSRSWATPA